MNFLIVIGTLKYTMKKYAHKILFQEDISREQFKIDVGHLRYPARHLYFLE